MRTVDQILAEIDTGNPHELAKELLDLALTTGEFERSVGNCHTAGVDSIVLFDRESAGGGMIRFYWATKGKHNLVNLYNRDGHFTLGIHNHRYDLNIIPLVGDIHNVETRIDPQGSMVLHEYGFQSAIADDDVEAIGTVYRAERRMRAIDPVHLDEGDSVAMTANDLHTIHVPDNNPEGTAWMVIEKRAVDIVPVIYSPRDDLTITSKELYLPMSRDRAIRQTERVLTLAQ